MSFQNKYLKYKNKYLELKIQYGGDCNPAPDPNDNTYNNIPPSKLITIGSNCFDVEQLARRIRTNPTNPMTGLGLSSQEIWRIIVAYNNYANGPEPQLNYPRNLFNYTQPQLIAINNAINNDAPLPYAIRQMIDTIKNSVLFQPMQSPIPPMHDMESIPDIPPMYEMKPERPIPRIPRIQPLQPLQRMQDMQPIQPMPRMKPI